MTHITFFGNHHSHPYLELLHPARLNSVPIKRQLTPPTLRSLVATFRLLWVDVLRPSSKWDLAVFVFLVTGLFHLACFQSLSIM
jgi:hypothetical protein